jgi:hypothetical protein
MGSVIKILIAFSFHANLATCHHVMACFQIADRGNITRCEGQLRIRVY